MEKAKLFRIALTVAGISLREWASEHDVAEVTVYELLKGRMTSARLTAAMDAFIYKQFSELRKIMEAF